MIYNLELIAIQMGGMVYFSEIKKKGKELWEKK
jgi:hypothetical protein